MEALTVFNDALYATCYDEGSVFRFDGERWEDLGKLPGATQTYGFGVHRGELFVSEWPQAHVFRWAEQPKREWIDTGKLGTELEAMPLLVYNGKLYCGTLPSAEVFRFDGPEKWFKIGRVDQTPDVKYRRAWSMAIYNGRLFVGTLPSGRVQSIEAGRNVTLDRAFPSGWHHVAAVREAKRLRLFVDGGRSLSRLRLPKRTTTSRIASRFGSGPEPRTTSMARLPTCGSIEALSDDQIKALADIPARKEP